MMPNMNMVESVNNALDTMLSKDNDVIMFGEDIDTLVVFSELVMACKR